MDKLVEWEITLKCNYKCAYCTNLDPTIRPELDETKIRDFIKSLGEKYPGVEIFVFGGEPFVHPKIAWIIKCFNEFKIPFVIQTNFSFHSIKIMKTITDPFKINISIHPTEIALEDIPKLFEYQPNIKTIDVMYTGREAIHYYYAIKKIINHDHLYLTPITDFGDGYSDTLLSDYLKIKQSLNKLIRFEQVERLGRSRSELWLDPEFTTFGKPCIYTNRYFLYAPNLELFNCCYRKQTDGICQQPKCFLM